MNKNTIEYNCVSRIHNMNKNNILYIQADKYVWDMSVYSFEKEK